MPSTLRTGASFSLLALSALILACLPGCGGTASTAAADEGLIVVRRHESGDPRTMDPHTAGDVVSSRHCGMTYECLYQYDYLKRPATLIPCIAAAKPVYSADKKTLTVEIREGIFFQDDRCFHQDALGKSYRDPDEGKGNQSKKGKGREVTARDVEYSIKRFASLHDTSGFWVIEGKIEGLDEFRAKAIDLRGEGPDDDPEKFFREHFATEVSGVTVLDDRHIRIDLVDVYPQFLYAMTLSYGAVVAHEAVDYYGKDFFRKPVGTGPFVLKEWALNWNIVWERNPTFRDERFPSSNDPEDEIYKAFMGKRLPLADRVDFRIIRESQPSFLKFLQGQLDVSGISMDQFDMAVNPQSEITPELAKKGILLRKYAEPTIHYVCFNMDHPLTGSAAGERGRAIRRAFALSIDREDFIQRYKNGRGVPAQQLVPPGTKGHQDVNRMAAQRYDPAEGRRVLEEAGFDLSGVGEGPYTATDNKTGRRVTLEILLRGTTEASKQYARFLTACGDKVGVQVQPDLVTFSEFLTRTRGGKTQAYDSGWIMDYPDAQNMLQLLYSPNRPPGINGSAYHSLEYDKLYRELERLDDSLPDDLKRKLELIRKMHKVLDYDVPWAIFEFRKTFSLYHSWYTPGKPNAFAYTYIKFAHSDSALRAEKAQSWSNTAVLPGILLFLLFATPIVLMGRKIYRQSK